MQRHSADCIPQGTMTRRFFCIRFTSRLSSESSLYTLFLILKITACRIPKVRLTARAHNRKTHPSSDTARYVLTPGSIHGIRISAQNSPCHQGEAPSSRTGRLSLYPLPPGYGFRRFLSSLSLLSDHTASCENRYTYATAPAAISTIHRDHTSMNTDIYQKLSRQISDPVSTFHR